MEIINFALPALIQAFDLIFTWEQISWLVVGVVLGLSVGIFPGLGGIAGLSLVLPFLYGMDPVSGLAMMVGLVAVIPTSDTFASVLMGIPGSSASQATILDGFPLSKNGQAARALSAAFVSSLFGGIFGAIVLTFFIIIARPIVLSFRLPELLMLTILGLSMVGILSGNSGLKGVIAACLGLAFGAIGEAPALGSPRMDFGNWYLQDGFQLVIVGLGIFAIPEIISLMRHDRSISKSGGLGKGWSDGVRDWWRNIWLSLRCSSIGVIIGVIPGLGGSVVDWIAYGHTVQSSTDKSQFGKGDIRGVIGPESSNNAKEGGGLVPTLLFGIPGSASMAVFIGGLILLGYDAGPQMVKNDLPITYTIVWSLALANIFGAGLSLLLSSNIAKLTTIRFPLLVPFLFMMISFACFQSRQSSWDLVALVGIGILGIFMRRFDWSRPAFLIGFVLASQSEVYTYQALQVLNFRFSESLSTGLAYVFTPITITLFFITVVSIFLGIKHVKNIKVTDDDSFQWDKVPAVIFTLAITFFLLVFFIDSMLIDQMTDKIFPAIVTGTGLFASVLLLIQMRIRPADNIIYRDLESHGDDAKAPEGLWFTLGWLVALLILNALFGFIIALVLFFALYLRRRIDASWTKISILTISGIVFICFLASSLNREFPPGLLQYYFDLPWPLSGL